MTLITPALVQSHDANGIALMQGHARAVSMLVGDTTVCIAATAGKQLCSLLAAAQPGHAPELQVEAGNLEDVALYNGAGFMPAPGNRSSGSGSGKGKRVHRWPHARRQVKQQIALLLDETRSTKQNNTTAV